MDDIDTLRSKIRLELERLEILQTDSSKAAYRALHLPAVNIALEQGQPWIEHNYPKYARYFANGDEINPSQIRPALIEVTKDWHSDLFRLARLTWSLPFTSGYGRRLRFLLLDKSNEKLIGVLGLQSPPLDFPVRDRLFSYPQDRKTDLVNQTMDIYTLGAVPPYNRLLGGKLVALAAISDEVRQAYRRKYRGHLTEMQQRQLPPNLVALTTTSAFGRSSIYNRLTYQKRLIAQSIGYTEGYGSFHLAALYPLFREFLEKEGISTKGGFGVGPRRVWQICEKTMELLGFPKGMLKHGIKREAFLFPLISNLQEYLTGKTKRPIYYHQPFTDLADWWLERWLSKRSERVDGWHSWDRAEIEQTLIIGKRNRSHGIE